MTVVEKMARAMRERARTQKAFDSSLLGEAGDYLYDTDFECLARTALTALHDSFADPVVRAAIQAALDEKEG